MDKQIGALAQLPPDLHYLIEPALKYGVHQLANQVASFFENATEQDLEALASVAEAVRLNDHGELIDDFLDRYPMTEHYECAYLYLIYYLIDAAGLSVIDENWNSVENHIHSLSQYGSYRLACRRMWAARLLADFGKEASGAIPALRRVTLDADSRVRVWAHYALAIIEGQREAHERAIEEIYAQNNAIDPDLSRMMGEPVCREEAGREAQGALRKFREGA